MATHMDVLVLQNFVLLKEEQSSTEVGQRDEHLSLFGSVVATQTGACASFR